MLTSALAALVLAPQTKVDKDNYASFFRACQLKKAYLEAPADERGRKEAKFLGYLSDDKYDTKSLANTYGSVGSKYQRDSIWNHYGDFGSKFSDRSPWNAYGNNPVEILYREARKTYILGYLSDNRYIRVSEPTLPVVAPRFLAYWLDRGDDIP